MQPEIDLGPITLQTFGLMMGLGFVVAGLAASKYLKELGKPVDWAYEMVFAALVGGIVGARLWWIAENWSDAKDDLLGSLFSGAGLVWYGGALGGVRRGVQPPGGCSLGRLQLRCGAPSRAPEIGAPPRLSPAGQH